MKLTVVATAAPSPIARLDRLIPRLQALGLRDDATGAFPAESLALLVEADLHRVFAHPDCGGLRFADEAERHALMFEILRRVGRCDLSLGRLYEGHLNAVLLFDWYGSARQRRRLADDLDHGRLFGVWATEPQPGVTLHHDRAGWRLAGGKSFATGAGGLAFALVTAQPLDGPKRLAIVPADDLDRADRSVWRVRGMRATGSGTYDLSDLVVGEDDLLGAPGDYEREPRFNAGAWRFTAVQLGGVEALLTAVRAAMSDEAKAQPVQRARFADAVTATRGAYLWVREAARRAAETGSPAEDACAFARLTRGVVERAALEVMEIAARIVGTRSAFDGHPVDKIIRDLSLYLRQGAPDHARDRAALAWLDHDAWGDGDRLW